MHCFLLQKKEQPRIKKRVMEAHANHNVLILWLFCSIWRLFQCDPNAYMDLFHTVNRKTQYLLYFKNSINYVSAADDERRFELNHAKEFVCLYYYTLALSTPLHFLLLLCNHVKSIMTMTNVSPTNNEQCMFIISLALLEIVVMFLIDRFFTPTEVPRNKRSQFVRDILCIPISFMLWLLAVHSFLDLYSSGELRWFGVTQSSYMFLYLYVSHNVVQVTITNCL
jgi:hypothetical protein